MTGILENFAPFFHMSRSYSVANIKFHYDENFIKSLPSPHTTEAKKYLHAISNALDEPFACQDPTKFKQEVGMYINQYTFLQFLQRMNVHDVFVM